MVQHLTKLTLLKLEGNNMSLLDTLKRGVALRDRDLITLHQQLGDAHSALTALDSCTLEITTDHLSRIRGIVEEILFERCIGYSVSEGVLYAAKITGDTLYTAETETTENFQWENQYRIPKPDMDNQMQALIAHKRVRTIAADLADPIHLTGYENHYDYLDKVLPVFWVKCFGKTLEQSGCDGIAVAHGDKGYQYREQWDQSGVPFFRGMLLYMLTYTNLMTHEKHHSRWAVVEFYHKYRDLIIECEQLA